MAFSDIKNNRLKIEEEMEENLVIGDEESDGARSENSEPELIDEFYHQNDRINRVK